MGYITKLASIYTILSSLNGNEWKKERPNHTKRLKTKQKETANKADLIKSGTVTLCTTKLKYLKKTSVIKK